MLARDATIVGDEFRPGFRLQTSWGWSMAAAFFLGELGAGLFLVSLFLDFVNGMVIGLALTAVGKTTGHMLHLGQPFRAWRAIVKVNRSWVSRGLLAIIVFTGFGIVHVLDAARMTFGLFPPWLSPVVTVIAGAAAVVVMLYQGLAMSHSPSISLWSTAVMPVLGFTYAALGGVALVLALGTGAFLAAQPQQIALLRTLELALIGYAAVMILSMLHAARYGSPGGQKSVELLLKGDLSGWFFIVVLGVGLILPGSMIVFGPQGATAAILTAAALSAGYFAFRMLVFKAALYDPMQSFITQVRRI